MKFKQYKFKYIELTDSDDEDLSNNLCGKSFELNGKKKLSLLDELFFVSSNSSNTNNVCHLSSSMRSRRSSSHSNIPYSSLTYLPTPNSSLLTQSSMSNDLSGSYTKRRKLNNGLFKSV